MAKATRTRVVFLSVGAGPLDSAWSKYLVRKALSIADYRSFRDKSSQEIVKLLHVCGENPVFPDLVFSLRVNDIRPARSDAKRHPIVGINPFPHCDGRYWPVSDENAYRDYINKMASFALWLLERSYSIFFFPSQIRADPLVIRDIKDLMAESGSPHMGDRIIERSILSVDDLLSQIAFMDLVVATRFHAILMSFFLNKPVLAIYNQHKMRDLMQDMGQGEFALDIANFDLKNLTERFLLLKSRSEDTVRRIERLKSENYRALELQYDRVFLDANPQVSQSLELPR